MKVAYWPGCVSRGFTPELHGSMAKVAPLLDIELVELDRASCSGAGVIAEHNQELADTLNARTFALAQQVAGAELMMNICSTCQGAQSECQERLDASAEYRTHINSTLAPEGLSYEKGLTNKNFLWLLVEEIGLDALRAKVKRPLTDLRVGPFYGCYIVRPRERLGIDAEHPRDQYLHQVIEALGGTVIDYAGMRKCCGFPIITMNKQASLKQAGRHLGDAVEAEADCLVTPCPLCHLNLDLQQPLAEGVVGRELEHAGPSPAPAGRARAGPRAQGARAQPPRRAADVGDRLVDLGGRRDGLGERGAHGQRRGALRPRRLRREDPHGRRQPAAVHQGGRRVGRRCASATRSCSCTPASTTTTRSRRSSSPSSASRGPTASSASAAARTPRRPRACSAALEPLLRRAAPGRGARLRRHQLDARRRRWPPRRRAWP